MNTKVTSECGDRRKTHVRTRRLKPLEAANVPLERDVSQLLLGHAQLFAHSANVRREVLRHRRGSKARRPLVGIGIPPLITVLLSNLVRIS